MLFADAHLFHIDIKVFSKTSVAVASSVTILQIMPYKGGAYLS